jgi:exopolyphosphatase/guanosine-5'-triphosphate,3'-diphosphate pyrophosphatase
MPHRRNLAAIDIGTSSVHLAIARPIDGGRPEILLREKLPVRLGSGVSDMKTLDPDAVDRTIEALSTFRALAQAHDAEIHAVATSAVREADDASAFLNRARDEAGIDVEVIAGVEEARLIHLGALGAVPIADTRHLVIDIGGGSTELIVGDGVEPTYLRSLKIGHVRLSNRFFPDGVATIERIDRCRRFIRSFIARDVVTIRAADVERVVGCSGTFETLATVARNSRPADDGEEHRDTIRRDEITTAAAMIKEARTPAERLAIRGVDKHRADTIVAGAILVETLMDELGFDEFVISPDALREGLVLDRIDRRDPSPNTLLHLNEIRSHSVHTVAERYGENIVHARQATDIALQIFDATHALHGLGKSARDLLEAAAMLHNIGRFVGHSAHHRHSYYLICNTEHLAGFNEYERIMIALIARYHRKSAPKPGHKEFASQTDGDQYIVSVLAGMLRIGIALDRTYRNAASELDIAVLHSRLDLVVFGDDLELEVFAANERKELLQDALGISVQITAAVEEN